MNDISDTLIDENTIKAQRMGLGVESLRQYELKYGAVVSSPAGEPMIYQNGSQPTHLFLSINRP